MIDKMTRYSFILLNGEETAFLEQLQEVGLVDITRSEKPMNEVTMGIAGEIERIDGLIKGLEKVDIPDDGFFSSLSTSEVSDDVDAELEFQRGLYGEESEYSLMDDL
jgi:V/A-type H+-transporting ATPase subunit I